MLTIEMSLINKLHRQIVVLERTTAPPANLGATELQGLMSWKVQITGCNVGRSRDGCHMYHDVMHEVTPVVVAYANINYDEVIIETKCLNYWVLQHGVYLEFMLFLPTSQHKHN